MAIAVFSSYFLTSQTCDINEQYSGNSGWNIVDLNQNGNTNPTPRIAEQNGAMQFINAPCGFNEIRAWKPIGDVLCNSWVVEFDVTNNTVDAAGAGNTGHLVFAATAGNLAPVRDFAKTDINQDLIGVEIADGNGLNDLRFCMYIKDGTTRLNPTGGTPNYQSIFVTPYQGSWHIRLERLDDNRARLTVTDQFDNVIGQICEEIPSSVNGLTHIQHSNNPIGGDARRLTASIDNLCLDNCFKVNECCINPDIEGPGVICDDEFLPIYTVDNSPGATYTWSFPGATFIGQGTSSIGVTDFPFGPGTYTISVDIECNCYVKTITKQVTINDMDASSFWRSPLDDGQGNITKIDAGYTGGGNNVNLTWNLYEATACDNSKIPVSPTPIATQTGNASVTFTSPIPNYGTMVTSKCYLLELIVSDATGSCPNDVYVKQIDQLDSESKYNGSSNSNSMMNNYSVVYPNPSSKSITLEVNNHSTVKSVSIWSIDGKLVKQINNPISSKQEINISTIPEGIYNVRIEYLEGENHSIKFSKN